MANFKVGQRFRVVNPEPSWGHLEGQEGAIGRIGPSDWQRQNNVPGKPFYHYGGKLDSGGDYNWYEWEIAPLTDPKADEWAADKVKQVTKPLMVERPVYTKERA